MYTVIKNQEAPVALAKQDFITRSKYMGSDAPRFDKINTRFLSPQTKPNNPNEITNQSTELKKKLQDLSMFNPNKTSD